MLTKNCLNCDSIILKKDTCSLKRWSNRVKFCSKDCMNLFRKNKPSSSPSTTFKKGSISWLKGKENPLFKGENNPKWKGGEIEKICKVCDAKFSVERNRKSTSKFCSVSCKAKQMKGKRFSKSTEFKRKYGIKNLNEIKIQIRSSNKYTNWRNSIFVRDLYKCILCGNGGKLNADHYPTSFANLIESLVKMCGEKYIYRNAMKYTKLWDISNGRTLCVECHLKTDNFGSKGIVYGKR